ncbi:hypothetical protein U1Q18_049927 [Sarracenia purpurea var. burkii]
MIHSALYILLIISLVQGVPNSYLDSLSNLGGWLSNPSNSENETEGRIDIDKTDDPVRRVVDESDKDIEAINPDKPILVDDFVEGFKNNVQNINMNEKEEIVGVLKVLYKGFWHLVDLGIAGTTQRKRSAEKTEGVFQAIADVFKAFNRAFWRFLGYADEEENHDGDSDDDSSDEKGKSDVVLKPLAKSEDKIPKAHTSANGRLTFDTNGREGIGGAMKALAGLSSLLGDKLKTREEVNKELKEAQDKDFDKTSDKTSMVKDILELSLQPLYYVETYDRITDFINRLVCT